MPKVSVVIPAYNCEKFIATAIESVLSQTYGDYEIIVVNDGSTDKTDEVISRYASKIKKIYQPNKGPANARNAGIVSASGEYIAFLDADDAWLPEKLEMQMAVFERNHNLGIMCSDTYVVDSGHFDKCDHSTRRYFQMWPPSRGDVFIKLFSQNFVATSTVIARKACFDKIGLFNPGLSPIEDYDRWLRISLLHELDFVDVPLSKHRDHVGIFRKNPILTLTNIINTYSGIGRDHPEAAGTLGKIFYRVIARFHISLGERYLFMGDLKNALRNFSIAIKMTKSYGTVLCILFSLLRDYPAVCIKSIIGGKK